MAGIINVSNVKKTVRYLKRNGISAAYYAALERIGRKGGTSYSYVPLSDAEYRAQSSECQSFEYKPKFSVIMPAYNTPEDFFKEAVLSVTDQTYDNWELIIADASDNNAVAKYAEEFEGDPRIRFIKLPENKGISENSNAALEYVTGDYVALLDHDDLFCRDALYRFAKCIIQNGVTANNPQNAPAFMYSDEDKYDSDGKLYFDPHDKYDFNYDLLLTNNYICHLSVIRRDMLDNIRFRYEYDGAQDYDLVLQIVRKLILEKGVAIAELEKHIIHVPHILYHWRSHVNSTADNTTSKGYAYEAGLAALKNHLDELGLTGLNVSHSKHLGFYKTDWPDDEKLFEIRPEIGAVIRRAYDKNGKMEQCIFDKDGNALYAGLNSHFSGEFNRFDCAQEVFAADIRLLEISKRAEKLYKEFISGESTADASDYRKLSFAFAKLLKENGMLIVYLP